MGNSPSHGGEDRGRGREAETEETAAEQTTAIASSDAGTASESNYQVFLSFRGPDTRVGFTDSLYHGLDDAGVCVFLDDEELAVGARIDGSLQRAINNSKIYIPIFSRTYASSQWCLRELAQIMANSSRSEGNKEILPIFFDVRSDDVKLKTPLYRDALQKLKHEKRLCKKLIDGWEKALLEVGAIKGWEMKKYNGQGKLIRLVVEEVVKKLKIKHRSVPKHLLGIDDQVFAVSELLDVDSGDVWFIRIYGMRGIGKTTLAKVIFNNLSSHFGKCCCFLEDVRGKSSTVDGTIELQKKLLSEIGAHAGTGNIDEIDDGINRIGEVLSKKKVFIVLDDVDNSGQVEKLVGNTTLHLGSRVLITTRNKDDLRIEYQILDYEMKVMSDDFALELFRRHVFSKDSPSYEYDDLSREIVSATGRLPLTLEVIGSFLYCKKTQKVWKETLKKLKRAPPVDVIRKLKISYDALTFDQQQIFLDIACFFVGEDKTSAFYAWQDCELFPYTEVRALISMSLVKIGKSNKFWMHDQLRDLGREIVQQKSRTNPGEQSRIWIREEILIALQSEQMKKKVVALDLDLRKSYSEVVIKSEEMGRFEGLKYLKLNGGAFVGNLGNSLTNLRWILWSHPHPTCDPTNMHLKNVVVLQFSDNAFIDDSNLQSFIKMTGKLKVLSLKGCDKITRTPDFSECLNLERLNVDHCSNLRKIDGSIGKLKCLTEMKIAYCPCLEPLPEEIGELEDLEHFTVQRCNKVKRLPVFIWGLKSLREVHFSI